MGGVMDRKATRDRRKYPRIHTDQLISFAPIESGDRLAVSKNLSVGGICFEVVGCEINLGEVLRLTFNVQDETIVAVGRVNWCTDIDAFTQEVGLEFIEIDPFALEAIERNAEGGAFVR
jgi:PilZ domain